MPPKKILKRKQQQKTTTAESTTSTKIKAVKKKSGQLFHPMHRKIRSFVLASQSSPDPEPRRSSDKLKEYNDQWKFDDIYYKWIYFDYDRTWEGEGVTAKRVANSKE